MAETAKFPNAASSGSTPLLNVNQKVLIKRIYTTLTQDVLTANIDEFWILLVDGS